MIELLKGQVGVLAGAAVLVFWMVGAYNRLVALRAAIGSAWTQYDAQLVRRREALMPLLASLRDTLTGEHATLDALLAAQAQVQAAADAVRGRVISLPNVAALAAAEGVFGSTMTRLRALIEQQSALREREDVTAALAELNDADQRLGFARQLFNDAGLAYDMALHQFPTRLLRRLFDFQAAGRL